MANVVTGSRVVFRIDGERVFYATTISYNESIEHEPIDVLDNIRTEEHVPVSYRVDFSVETFRIADKSVKQLGIMPVLDEILNTGDLTAEFVDTPTGKTIGLILGVRLTGRSGNVPTRGSARETLSFVGTIMRDESEV